MDNPLNYSKFDSNSVNEAQYFLSKYKNFFKWKESEDILDIGCANGKVTKDALYPFVNEYVKKLLGSDISQEAIEAANKMYATPKVSFSQMNADEENLGEKYKERFDHIFAFSVLHLLKIPENWSRNFYQMLKPNGQFFASIVVPPHPYMTVTTAQRGDKTAPWAKHMEKCPDIYVDYTPNPTEKIGGILKKAGFTIDVMELDKLTSKFEKIDDLNGTLLSANGFLKVIPETLRGAYVEDFFRRILEVADRGEDGSYCYTKNFVVVVATKM